MLVLVKMSIVGIVDPYCNLFYCNFLVIAQKGLEKKVRLTMLITIIRNIQNKQLGYE